MVPKCLWFAVDYVPLHFSELPPEELSFGDFRSGRLYGEHVVPVVQPNCYVNRTSFRLSLPAIGLVVARKPFPNRILPLTLPSIQTWMNGSAYRSRIRSLPVAGMMWLVEGIAAPSARSPTSKSVDPKT